MNDNKRIAVNSLVIFARLCVVSAIGLISARVVLKALGASDYGLYNVVGGIVTLLNIFNTAMVSTTYRYIAFELGKGEKGNTNRVFNASFVIHSVFAGLILFLGLTIGLWYINNYLNVEPGKLGDARFVFFLSIVTTMINTLFIPYSGLLIAYERFHVPAIIDIVVNVIMIALLVALLYYGGNKLRLYSIIMLACRFLNSLFVYIYSRRNFKSVIKFIIPKGKSLYREMTGFAAWILVGAVASVGRAQATAMIVNYFFGTIVNASFAIAGQVERFIALFSRSLNKAAIPQITKNYSGGNKNRSVKLTSYISKYTFFLMSLVAFPIFLEVDFLMGIWLEEVPKNAALYCRFMILAGLLGCTGEGLPALIQASGKIKYFQILSTLIILSVPIGAVFFYFGYPPHTIQIIFCTMSFIIIFLRLYLLKVIINLDIIYFVKTSYLRIFMVFIPMFVLYLFYDSSSFSVMQHFLSMIGLVLFLVLDIIIFGVDANEWKYIAKYIRIKK